MRRVIDVALCCWFALLLCLKRLAGSQPKIPAFLIPFDATLMLSQLCSVTQRTVNGIPPSNDNLPSRWTYEDTRVIYNDEIRDDSNTDCLT